MRRLRGGAHRVVMLAAFGLLVAGCRSRREPPLSMRLAVQDNTICALAFIAEAEGYYEREGLDLSLLRYPSGKLALLGMFDGEADVAACADMPIMSNSLRRDDFALFATIASTYRGAWIVARTDRGIAAAEDLRGKRIGTQQNSAVHFFLAAYLQRHGIPEDEVEIVFLQAVELAPALAAGRIDAFSMRNPFIADARQMLPDKTVELFGEDLYRKTFNLAARQEYLQNNAEACRRLVRALARAEALVTRNEAAALEACLRGMGADRKGELSADWPHFNLGLSLDQSLLLTLEQQARWALRSRGGDARAIPNYTDYIETAILEAVQPRAVTLIRAEDAP